MYLQKFNATRRVKRNPDKICTLDPLREAVGLPLGQEAEYFVAATGYAGQDHSDDTIDYNYHPTSQPSLCCGWTVTDDGSKIIWDEGEKFYEYIQWLDYIVSHFAVRWNRTLNGEMLWYGEDRHDEGDIRVKDNKISYATKQYILEEFNPLYV